MTHVRELVGALLLVRYVQCIPRSVWRHHIADLLGSPICTGGEQSPNRVGRGVQIAEPIGQRGTWLGRYEARRNICVGEPVEFAYRGEPEFIAALVLPK